MFTVRFRAGILPFRQVLAFVFRQSGGMPGTAAATIACVLPWTRSDVLMPVFAGRLVDAVAATDRMAARQR